LNELADATVAALEAANAATNSGDDADRREFNATELDLRVLAHVARYHAQKKLAATHFEFFRLTKDPPRLPLIWRHIKQSQTQWQQIVALTDGKYFNKMVFGFSHEHHSDFPDRLQVHVGHWEDRLVEVQRDVDFVAELLRQNEIEPDKVGAVRGQPLQRFPGETPLRQKPVIKHERVKAVEADQDIEIVAHVASDQPLRDVSVYYRVMDQTRPWKRIAMQANHDGTYATHIPGGEIDSRFDFLYYLEARVAHGGTFWPDWQHETPYIVVPVQQ
jgi:hypothetical protein